MYNVESIRKDFPILSQKIHNNDLVYFDNSATTQKPQIVIDAIVDAYSKTNSNIHRGIHSLSLRSTEQYEHARKVVANFINAPKVEEVIFTRGATDSVNLVAASFGEAFVQAGDEIIISAMEHHSNMVPWQVLCEKKGAILKYIPFSKEGVLDLDVFKSLLSNKTKLVAVVHVSNSLGTVNPIKEIIELSHNADVPVLIDGAQSIQHTKIDVQDLDCDFFAFSGHKIYAPTGIGVLWAKEKWLEKMPPYQSGGDSIETVTLEKTTFNVLPFKFESGTSNYVGAHALGVALDYVSTIGISNIAAHEQILMQTATNILQNISGVTIIGNAPQKSGAISFIVKGAHPSDIGTILDKKGIAIRTGTHCTEPIMQFYNITGTARTSFGMYNTVQEVEYFGEVLKRVVPMFL